ncbi:MAG: TonB-dependent receptor, partial [Acidobacteriaceae bacterium]
LNVSTQSQTVQVTDVAPVLDTAETRNQLTIQTNELESLPLPGRDQLGLVTLAPGVTGLGVIGSGGNGQTTDNYAAETQVTASANGRSSVGNMFVVDGLDITSNITPGVLNLVPNPDTIQEATVQVNTFDVEYGRSSSIVEVMTTRSGGDQYHFLASDYYTANWLTARTEFQPSQSFNMLPFHSSNMSATLGGPIPFLKRTYFFTGWEPLLSSTQSASQITVEDPQFTTWAQANWPNSVGVALLAKYPSVNVARTGVASTGASLFKTSCGTAAAANIPCSLPVVDNGVFNATNYRNALQYNIRLDKYFSKDRMYANYYRTSLYTGGPSVRVDHGAPQQYLVRSIQGNETHTFSDHWLNEAAFGFLRMDGLIDPSGPFHIPIISVSSAWGTQLGVSKAHENYVQHHFVWKDDVNWVHGPHDIKFGYEGFHGDNLTYFGQWYSQPNYSFQNLAAFVQDQIYQETGVAYNLLTGQQAGLAGGSFQFNGSTFGLFAQDNWKVNRRLTLTYGLRWDDFGNPSPENGSVEANFFLGQGSTIPEQIASGSVKQVKSAFNNTPTAWSPRIGAAWDITGNAKWLLHGGFGLYHDWITLGNVQNEFGNPPAPATVTFQTNTSGAQPIYSVGTSDTYPFGFTYPSFAGYTLNAQGGITGQQISIAGNDPNLKASNTMNYTATIERGLGHDYSIAAGYSGSHSNNLFTDFGGHTTNAYYGQDVNNFPGSLIQNNGKLVRLNTSFGTIRYTVNGPTATYNAFIAEFKGRFLRNGFIDTSYTRSVSKDDAGSYPTPPSNSGNYS